MSAQASPSQRRIHAAAMRLFTERGSSRISITELAEAAGVSRGTVYNHVDSLQELFGDVAAGLSEELSARVVQSLGELRDPAARLALGIRWYVQQAHDDPGWSRFVTRFAFSNSAMRGLRSGPATRDIVAGVSQRRYAMHEHELQAAMAFVGSSVLAAMYLVREGLSTWRDAGSHCALMVLRGLGVPAEEARQLATVELPGLAPPLETSSTTQHREENT